MRPVPGAPSARSGSVLEPRLSYGRHAVSAADAAAVQRVLESDWLTQGPAVHRFEEQLARRCGAAFAVCTANGTAALHVALRAAGVGPGALVVTSAVTFLASATSALMCGAEVEFVDVDAESSNMDLDILEARCARGGVDAVVAVHFAGLPCDMQRLVELKRRHGFALIEDACHALGARYACHGRDFATGGHPEVDATVFSFHPVKHVTTGEGGAVLGHDAAFGARVRRLCEHGVDRASGLLPFSDSAGSPPWFAPMLELGFNYRLSELGAALGSSQLAALDERLARRRELAERYAAQIEGFDLPRHDPGHAWHLYVLHEREGRRDELMAHLRERGIDAQVHYYPVPMQPFFRARYGEPCVPRAERHARTCLSLPLYDGLATADQRRVIEALEEWRRA